MSELDLRALLGALNQREVHYVVIGGVAVGAHGYLRATEDLDIVPDTDPDNLARLAEALDALGASLPTARGRRFDPVADLAALRRGKNVTADTRFGGLDVVQLAAGVPPFSVLDGDAVDSDVLGEPVRICSLARLREMKAVRNRAQDLADLENLPEA